MLALAGDPIDALWVVLAYVAIQQVESSVLTPLVTKEAASLRPVVAIASVTVGGTAFGILGKLSAVPAVVVAGVVVEKPWFERIE